MKREVKMYLSDILDSMDKIEIFSKGLTKEKLLTDDLRQSAIIRQFEIIGEATKNIPNVFREKYPEV
ncbi:MAG: HepT-like ribonuclease domain-containing protein, partial [Nanoarchaeota archaeon]